VLVFGVQGGQFDGSLGVVHREVVFNTAKSLDSCGLSPLDLSLGHNCLAPATQNLSLWSLLTLVVVDDGLCLVEIILIITLFLSSRGSGKLGDMEVVLWLAMIGLDLFVVKALGFEADPLSDGSLVHSLLELSLEVLV
jgi:hypothetical protein